MKTMLTVDFYYPTVENIQVLGFFGFRNKIINKQISIIYDPLTANV